MAGTILAQPGVRKQSNDMGIMRAIIKARKMAVVRKPIDYLMLRYNTETHTFIAFWRVFSLTLEEVAILTSVPMFGEDRVASFKNSEREDKKRLDALTSFLSKLKYSTNKATYLSG